MRTFVTTLAAQPVTVLAPEVGTFDPAEFRAAFPTGGLYGLDVESTALDLDGLRQFHPDFDLRLIQFGTTEYAWVLNLSDTDQREAAVEMLADTTTWFCSHTSMDVLSVGVRLGVDITERNIDTRNLAIMAHPQEGKNRDLKTLTTQYIGPELHEADVALDRLFEEMWPGRKNAKKDDKQAHGWNKVSADDPTYLTYAGLDAIACRQLVDILAKETDAPADLIRMEVWLAGQANRIQLRGHRVDLDMLKGFNDETSGEVDRRKAKIMDLTGGINPQGQNFPKWLAEHGVDWIEWRQRGYALTKPGKTGQQNPSLAKDNVHLLKQFPLDPAAAEVYEELVVLKANLDGKTKTDGVIKALAPSGHIHPSLNTMGASTTARMSSTGPNMQNFSKRDPRMRGMFLPELGHVLMTIDFEQVELRVVAALAREDKMIDTILAGGDLHQLTVDELAAVGVTISRDQAKIVNFLIVYGGGGKALHEQTGIPLDEANAIVRAHRERYTKISALSQRLGQQERAVKTVSNRRLPVTTNKRGEPRAYANVNYVVQSSARELLVDAWYRFGTEFGYADRLWFPIHDELTLHTPVGDLLDVADAAERSMRFDFMGVPISATAELLLEEDGTSRWMTSKKAEAIRKAKGFTSEAYPAPERAYMESFLRGDLTSQAVAA